MKIEKIIIKFKINTRKNKIKTKIKKEKKEMKN